MCTEEEIILYIETDNFKTFYEKISIKLINKASVFTFAVDQKKIEYIHFMLTKIKDTQLIRNATKTLSTPSIKQLLLNRLLSIDTQQKAGYNRLHIAVIDDEVDLVEYLLNGYSDYNGDNSKVGTPFHLAITLCRFRCVKKFIEYEVNVDTLNQYNESPLHLSLLYNVPMDCYDIFGLSESIDERKYNGLTVLQMAVVRDASDAIGSILAAGADINMIIKTTTDGSMKKKVLQDSKPPALPLSNKENSLTLCLKLHGSIYTNLLHKLNKGSVTMTDGEGNTLLHMAAVIQDISLCNAVLSKGADINALNNRGNNALEEMLAMRSRMVHSIKKPSDVGILLIDKGIDANKLGADGMTILYKSSEVNSQKLFEKVFSSMSIVDLSRVEFEAIVRRRWFSAASTILSSLAAGQGHHFVTKFVQDTFYSHANDSDMYRLTKYSPVSVKSTLVPRLLYRAAFGDQTDIFTKYLKIDVEEPSNLDTGETILTNLIKTKKTSFIDLLLKSSSANAYVNRPNMTGDYPLHVAADLHDESLCELLLLHGADVNATNQAGDNALQKMINLRIYWLYTVTSIVNIGTLLIDAGLDTNIKGSDGRTILHKCSKINDEKFFLKVLNKTTVFELTVNEVDAIAHRKWFDSIKAIISIVPEPKKELYLMENVINIFYNHATDLELLEVLSQCSTSIREGVVDNLLNRSALEDKEDVFNQCLALPAGPPRLLDNGETVLTNLILLDESDYSTLLLESSVAEKYVNVKNSSGEYPLHLAARVQDMALCRLIISKHADVNAVNERGNNAMNVMLDGAHEVAFITTPKRIIDVASLLLDNGIDRNQRGSDGRLILNRFINLKNEQFFMKVLQSMMDIDLTVPEFETVLKNKWYMAANGILSMVDHSRQCCYATETVIDMYYRDGRDPVVMTTIKELSGDIMNVVVNGLRHRAAVDNDNELFDEYLKINVKYPSLLSDGETLLTSLMKRDKIDFVFQLLESLDGDCYVNSRNGAGEYPLHVAFKIKNESLIDHLVVETIDINAEDRARESFIGLLFAKFDSQGEVPFVKRIAKLIISMGGNLYHQNADEIKDIERCMQSQVKEHIVDFAKKHINKMTLNKECSICMVDRIDCFLSCGHVYCSACASKVTVCPMCRKPSESTRKLFL